MVVGICEGFNPEIELPTTEGRILAMHKNTKRVEIVYFVPGHGKYTLDDYSLWAPLPELREAAARPHEIVGCGPKNDPEALGCCEVCGTGEGTIPTDCPGYVVPGPLQALIMAGRVDFVKGRWVGIVSSEPQEVL